MTSDAPSRPQARVPRGFQDRRAASLRIERRILEAVSGVYESYGFEALDTGGSPNVTSWYKNATGRVSQNWPFPIVDYWTATVVPNPEDFVLEGAPGA